MGDELKKIIEKLKSQGEMRFFKAATEEEISEFEKKNGIRLPKQYKEWLMFSDGGELFLPSGVQFYGIAHKPLLDIGAEDKPDEKYFLIGALSSGDPLLCEKDSEEISIYNHGAGEIEKDEVYEDFYSFLKDLYSLLGMEDD